MASHSHAIRPGPRAIAIAGCRVAVLLILAAAVLWIVNPPMPYERLRFCQTPRDAITTLWDKTGLGEPLDEQCAVRVGPRTVAAGMALGGLATLVVLGIPVWLTRRRSTR
jgi:hypothetical protein